MATVYPISIPTIGGISNIGFDMMDVVGASESPYTFSQEIYEHPGKRWSVTVQLAIMKRIEAEEWVAFLASLRGRKGTFLLGDPAGKTARGVLGGIPLVKGAGQTGGTLLIDGCSVGTVGWLKKGDWIQLGSGSSSRLHKSLTDVDTNGLGEATLELWPGPRIAPSDNEALITSNTQGVWRLSENLRHYDIESSGIMPMSFKAVEAL